MGTQHGFEQGAALQMLNSHQRPRELPCLEHPPSENCFSPKRVFARFKKRWECIGAAPGEEMCCRRNGALQERAYVCVPIEAGTAMHAESRPFLLQIRYPKC